MASRKNKRTPPKQRPGETIVYSYPNRILRPTGGHLMSPKWSQSHDNGKTPVSRGGAEKLFVRVPSIKRTTKVWRNFYHLFPSVYFRMKELADERGIKEGIMTLPWPTWAHLGDGWLRAPYTRMVKVRVLDLTGEFTQISPRLANQTLYRQFDSTILDRNSKRNRSFTQRNIDIYIQKA